MDIKPPAKRRPVSAPETPSNPAEQPVLLDSPVGSEAKDDFSINSKENPKGLQLERRKLFTAKRVLLAIAAIIIVIVAAATSWYLWAIAPVSTDETRQKFLVTSGETPSVIARNLEQAHLIRNSFAFEVYAKAHGVADSLQAGSYKLSPSQSVASIVGELVKGQNASYNVLISPGLTLKQLADPSVKSSFAAQGFSAEEIQQAFSATYTSPLLKDKPANATLEGYIFPETFSVKEGGSLQSVLERSFDELYNRMQEGGLLEKIKTRGLTIHQAITLASIIQQEVSDATDQRQVAQVFLKRLNESMLLGSDVTALYGAQIDGITLPSDAAAAAAIAIRHDSPYNTRIHSGLPPGPISNMNFSALEAVANPASGDYLYFVAGDGEDTGKTYFSRTYEEHQAAVSAHCHTLCSE